MRNIWNNYISLLVNELLPWRKSKEKWEGGCDMICMLISPSRCETWMNVMKYEYGGVPSTPAVSGHLATALPQRCYPDNFFQGCACAIPAVSCRTSSFILNNTEDLVTSLEMNHPLPPIFRESFVKRHTKSCYLPFFWHWSARQTLGNNNYL